MSPDRFDAAMAQMLGEAARLLRPDRFAVFVVGSVRDKDGSILDMRRCMSAGCEKAGLRLVNDAVLINATGTAAVRAKRGFLTARTLTRVHQEVLIYVKGDRKRAAQRMGEPDRGSLLDAMEDTEK